MTDNKLEFVQKHELKDSSQSIASSNRQSKRAPDIVSISNLVADAEDIAGKIQGDQIQPTIKVGSTAIEDPVPGQPRSDLNKTENKTQDKSELEMHDVN
jgi:hypothetical protein